MIAIGMIVCVFALPLKAVKGDIKSKLKKIDYGGSLLTLAWAVLILLPLSWSVHDTRKTVPGIVLMTSFAGVERNTNGTLLPLSRHLSLARCCWWRSSCMNGKLPCCQCEFSPVLTRNNADLVTEYRVRACSGQCRHHTDDQYLQCTYSKTSP